MGLSGVKTAEQWRESEDLVKLCGVVRAVEEKDGSDQLGESYDGVETLEPLECGALLLSAPLVRCHVQVGECHLEYRVSNPAQQVSTATHRLADINVSGKLFFFIPRLDLNACEGCLSCIGGTWRC